jgi:hypothetical protein
MICFIARTYIRCIWFGMTVLFDLYIVRDNPNILVYTPLLLYLLLFRGFCCKCFCIVIAVFNVIFALVSSNIRVPCLVSCSKYANVIHLLCSLVFVWE